MRLPSIIREKHGKLFFYNNQTLKKHLLTHYFQTHIKKPDLTIVDQALFIQLFPAALTLN